MYFTKCFPLEKISEAIFNAFKFSCVFDNFRYGFHREKVDVLGKKYIFDLQGDIITKKPKQ